MNVHDGHRARVIERFRKEGLSGFAPHNVLELLLFFAQPRVDTNETAHRLIKRFGSVSGVLRAERDDLLSVDGVGERAAELIKLLPAIEEYCAHERQKVEMIRSPEDAGNLLMSYLDGRTEERVMLLCTDAKGRATGVSIIREGNLGAADISCKTVVRAALSHDAVFAVLGHNHPSGVALPSAEDIAATEAVQTALEAVGVELSDHIIVADGAFVSMLRSGYFKRN